MKAVIAIVLHLITSKNLLGYFKKNLCGLFPPPPRLRGNQTFRHILIYLIYCYRLSGLNSLSQSEFYVRDQMKKSSHTRKGDELLIVAMRRLASRILTLTYAK